MNTKQLASELRSIAEEIAQSVGQEMHERRSQGFSWETKSTATDVVTEIDTWSEEVIVGKLTSMRPSDGLLGEEGTNTEGTSGVRWVIDPIDGTTNFLYGLPGYSVSIGAEIEGSPIAGAVFDPIRSELFSASVGSGATRNDTPIEVSGKSELSSALVATGFGYDPERRKQQAETLRTVLPAVRDIRRFGGAALDLCSVACGRVDAYFELGIQPWDACAGSIIASEAGALVSIGHMSIVASPAIADPLTALLEAAGY